MGKRRKTNKKNKVQKNRDIEELVEKAEENADSITSMEDVMSIIDTKDAKTEKSEKTEREEFLSNIRITSEKKYQNIADRKSALANDEERKCAYLKAVDKILKNEDEDTLEI